MRVARALVPALAVLALAGAASPPEIVFTDVSAAAGIRFVHNNGAFGKKYLPETLGPGCVFFDFDNDGRPDILLVNSTNWPGHAGPRSHAQLYHNNGDGTFTDVTAGSGLDVELYGMGGAAADYDNDGRADVFISAVGGGRLFHNDGGGKFSDVTAHAGIADKGFSTGVLWFDYDNDGKLDLLVAHYVDWSIDKDLFCTLDGKAKSYCTPESYKGQSATLYHNRGNGTFEDVTRAAGLLDPGSKALGVAMLDFDNDGWMDVFVANDTQPNKLYRNRGNGTFADTGVPAGVAFSDAGVARAGMGVDAADYDASGRASLIIGNFSNEMLALYHNEGNGLFIDEAATAGVGRPSLLTLTFACFFFDYDLDGRPDIFAANGHVADDINRVQPRVTYAQPAHLFHNTGGGHFEEMTDRAGPALKRPVVARGAAYADFDNDGDLDLLIAENHGPARLLRNDGGNRHSAIRVRTVGTASNRDGIGARVDITLGGGAHQWQIVKTGSSYCSQSELPVTFGLGDASRVSEIKVRWPSGRVDAVKDVGANQTVTIQEGKGMIAAVRFARHAS